MKYGRTPAIHDLHTMRTAMRLAPHLDALGVPPLISNDYVAAVDKATGGDWGMFANDKLGDCVCADTAHTLMLRTANLGSIVIPDDGDVVALYEKIGGYDPADPSTDNGCSETFACEYLKTAGLLGHHSAATAMIDPFNLFHLCWAVQLFGHCRIGLNMPAFALDLFNQGKPWDVSPHLNNCIEGGHDVPIVKYDLQHYYVVTWGRLHPVTPAFLKEFCDEAHAEIYPDWISAAGTCPIGLDLKTLLADLAVLKR